MTTIGDLFSRSGSAAPFLLAPTWSKAKPLLDPLTPMNDSTTNDIIGGSGCRRHPRRPAGLIPNDH